MEEDYVEDSAYTIEKIAHEYLPTYDWMYNHSDEESIKGILELLEFDGLADLFSKERIDLELFLKLEKDDIMEILKDHPRGLRLKFYQRYLVWKKAQNEDVQTIGSENTLFSTPSTALIIDNTTFATFMNSEEGENFTKKYPKNLPLNMEAKRQLCHILCTHLLSKGCKLGKHAIMILAESIPTIFPNEDPKVYYDGIKGILYSKATNLSTKIREEKRERSDVPPPKKQKTASQQKVVTFSTDIYNADTFVRTHPTSTTEEFMHYWRSSLPLRYDQIKNGDKGLKAILEKYTTYSRSDGFIFLLSDFNKIYLNEDYSGKWNALLANLSTALKSASGNAEISSILNNLSSQKEESRTIYLLSAVHRFLYSTYGTKKDAETKSKNRESIVESFGKLFFIISDELQINEQLSVMQQKCVANKTTLQPCIIGIGVGFDCLNGSYFVCFNEHKYKIDDLNKAIEVLLKMYMFFDLTFPASTKNILEFLTSYLFNYEYSLSSKCRVLLGHISKNSHNG